MLSTLLGTRLTLWLGPGVPIPAPLPVTEALRNVEVTQVTAGRDGFQLTFSLPRGPFDIVDYSLLANPLLRPFSRVIVQVWSGPVPQVLIDGVITHHQIAPEDTGSGATLTVTGEDLRVLMDLREIPMIYPQMTPEARVFLILAKYAVFIGGAPIVIPARIPDVPLLIDRIPSQAGTDLAYVQRLAEDHGYVFYLEPTPVPMVNLAYWGPENRLSIPQPALSVNLGPQTNVSSLNFRYDALQPETVLGVMQERRTRAPLPVVTVTGLKPPLAMLPATAIQAPYVRSVQPQGYSKLDAPQAFARAQALTDRAADAVTAEGELDMLRYGSILRARRIVGVRGAGALLDGFYYVSKVTHKIQPGSYTQHFTLTREGLGAVSPVVMP